MNRGNLLLGRRDAKNLADGDPLAGAVTAYLSAIERLTPLAAEYPGAPRYRKELAASYNGLGSVRLLQENVADARKSWQQARAQQEALISAWPKHAEYRSALGLTLGNLALIARRENDSAAASKLLEEAIEHQSAAVQLAEGNVTYPRFLSNHRQVLARHYLAESQHALAAAQAEQLAASRDWTDNYRAAELAARCIPLALADATQEEPVRQQTADEYARRAVSYLQRAVQHGFQDAHQLDRDDDFLPLRARAVDEALVRGFKQHGD
jgi:hypothetical protein